MSSLTPLEQQVIDMLLCGEKETLATLRRQAKSATISSRKMTGVGFFIDFSISPEEPRIGGQPSFELGDVDGRADNVRNGLGFLLFVRNGALACLEGYTYDEPWPDSIQGLRLAYVGGQDRDMKGLKEKIGE